MLINDMIERGVVECPDFISTNTMYIALVGSHCYGCNTEDSDYDIYGFCIPTKEEIFPHLSGTIRGFDMPPKGFEQWFQHGIKFNGKEYDLTIKGIVNFFRLIMENNPNMVDCLYVPQNCILHQTKIAQMVLQNRDKFLHKGSFHRFKGYAYSQLSKMTSQKKDGKRKDLVDKFGYDTKHAAHVIRLLDECRQIFETGTIDLKQKQTREHMKAIRRGDWTIRHIQSYFDSNVESLQKLYDESTLPWGPDVDFMKSLMLDCIEEHYGSFERYENYTKIGDVVYSVSNGYYEKIELTGYIEDNEFYSYTGRINDGLNTAIHNDKLENCFKSKQESINFIESEKRNGN